MKALKYKLDNIDHKILRALSLNARRTTAEIAELAGLSPITLRPAASGNWKKRGLLKATQRDLTITLWGLGSVSWFP
ncbi:AsnC family transcriptional regulator [Dickeya fangzhongdai]|uniref:AsnC family transcriptional regulator n=1 Tax=Dickeya fangzhongdai TaxID=1778540 RepID=UPI000907A22D